MDKRTHNRLKEHSGDGHQLQETEPQGHNLQKINKLTGEPTGLFICSCGWKGWLDKNKTS